LCYYSCSEESHHQSRGFVVTTLAIAHHLIQSPPRTIETTG
jgi:hypothetical protein